MSLVLYIVKWSPLPDSVSHLHPVSSVETEKPRRTADEAVGGTQQDSGRTNIQNNLQRYERIKTILTAKSNRYKIILYVYVILREGKCLYLCFSSRALPTDSQV